MTQQGKPTRGRTRYITPEGEARLWEIDRRVRFLTERLDDYVIRPPENRTYDTLNTNLTGR